MAAGGEDKRASSSPVSLFDAYVSLGEGECDLMVRCLLTLSGRVETERLREAIRLLLRAEPVLCSRFERRPSWPRWLGDASSEERVFSVLEGPGAEERLVEEIARPGEPFSAPQFEVCQARSGEHDLVLLRVSHVSVDAGGLKEIAYALAATYRALGGGGTLLPPIRRCERPEALLRGLPHPALVTSVRRAIGPRPIWGVPGTRGAPCDPKFVLQTVAASQVAAARALAETRGVPMTVVLAAALYRALFAVLAPPERGPLPIRIPVNLRRYLSEPRPPVFRNLFGGFQPAISYRKGESFEETLVRVACAVAPFMADRPGLEMAPALRALFSFGYAPGHRLISHLIDRAVRQGHSHLVFSNMGVLDPDRLSFGDVEATGAFLLGPVAYPPSFCLVATTYRGAMTLGAGTSGGETGRALMGAVLERMAAELPA